MAGCYGFLIRAIHLSARLCFHCSFHWASWPASATYFAHTAEPGINYTLLHQTQKAWFASVITGFFFTSQTISVERMEQGISR